MEQFVEDHSLIFLKPDEDTCQQDPSEKFASLVSSFISSELNGLNQVRVSNLHSLKASACKQTGVLTFKKKEKADK